MNEDTKAPQERAVPIKVKDLWSGEEKQYASLYSASKDMNTALSTVSAALAREEKVIRKDRYLLERA